MRWLSTVWALCVVQRALCEQEECDPLNATEFGRVSRVRCIVTGLEHSGTTILSQLIMASPGVLGGFECGLLMAPSPRHFPRVHPFYEWMAKGPETRHWGVEKHALAKLSKESRCHAEFYSGLFELSPILSESREIVDKTPRYLYELSSIMRRSPGVPVVVIAKSESDQMRSWAKRRLVGRFAQERYQKGMRGLDLALSEFSDRILVVNFTSLRQDPFETMNAVYDFVGLGWRNDFVTLDAFNAKFQSFGAKPAPALEISRAEE